MASILLLSRYDPLGASSRLRMFAFLPALAAAGFDVALQPLLDAEYLQGLYAGRRPDPRRLAGAYARRLKALAGAGRFDVVWLEKEALPWLPAGLERAFLARVPYVMDIDDAWFHRYGLHRRAVVRGVLGRKLEALAQGARLVVAGSPHLAAWAEAAGAARVMTLPTVVDLERYPPPTSPASREGPLVVGWIGTPATRPYLDLVGEALARLGPRVRLEVVGAGAVRIPGVKVTSRPWREADEVADLARFDVGIMPLADGPWEQGKCGYKLIQYMAAGRPVIASPVGVNTEIVAHGVNGFLAADTEGWVEALSRLAEEPESRQRMGAAGRARVETDYALQVAAPRLVAAFAEIAPGR